MQSDKENDHEGFSGKPDVKAVARGLALLQVLLRAARSRSWLVRGARLALLLSVVATGWCVAQHRLGLRSWQVPIDYHGDALVVLARMQSAAQGHYWPLLPKRIPELGAPFVATWDGHPTSEDWLYTSAGLLARWIGLFPAANLTVLLGLFLSALSTYWCCRKLRCRWEWSFVCALAFAWSPYVFYRGLAHVMLVYTWLLPPSALLTLWMVKRDVRPGDTPFTLAILIAFAVGWNNIYYSYLFLQWVALAGAVRVLRLRDWRALLLPAVLASATAVGCFLANVDSLPFLWAHRGEPSSFQRPLEEIRALALRPLSLLVPMQSHRWAWWAHWGTVYRQGPAELGNEAYYGYLGLLGMGALIGLGVYSASRVMRRPARSCPVQAWLALWVFAFAMVGGLNEALGMLGIRSFRGANRYSIAVLALALLFLAQLLTAWGRAWPVWRRLLTWAVLCALVGWDQLLVFTGPEMTESTAALVASDRTFVTALEKRLAPEGAMVFQLPIAGFPETPPINGMLGYEHFRPYLHARHLRFSYGSHKNDDLVGWQHELEFMTPEPLADRLERHGFAAILLNRDGYPDRGESVIQALRASGRDQVMVSPAGDWVGVLLHPVAAPQLPQVVATFAWGWYPLDKGWGKRWRPSDAKAQLKLTNTTAQTVTRDVSFRVEVLSPRRLFVRNGSATLIERALVPGQPPVPLHITLSLPPGTTKLDWTSDVPAAPQSPENPRPLAFAVSDFRVSD